MKKYLFVFSILASLATVACDTPSKASTTQQAIAVTPHAPDPVPSAPVAVDTAISPMSAKQGFKKKMKMEMMQAAPMTPEEKHRMLRAEEKPLPKN